MSSTAGIGTDVSSPEVVITPPGLRTGIQAGVQYVAALIDGADAVAIDHLAAGSGRDVAP